MLDLEDLPEDVDSFAAQGASFYVHEEYPEQWLAFDEAIFEALWIDGRDISDVDVLADIADVSGLDGDEIRTAIADGQLRDRLRDQFSEAQQDGVTGVPTFVYEGYAARGAVPPEQLKRLIEGT
ncbi:DSBA-like thioredoxin domain-containing protein [Halorubrum vacuolatum]|uniref:DSBA-like thioredoxin domain-containing protein n=1 Tax=Halorubrum vacuolatum TaxID=63740 RepID=A0A238XGG9_HALVU|nr:DSBA-like thioredoxin domain-containing protein [Halorubrum vacuolatum]